MVIALENSERKHTVAVVGGDKRQTVVASLLAEKGHTVKVFGLRSNEKNKFRVCDTLSDCVSKSDIIILPLPVSKDGVYLIAPDYPGSISLYDVLNLGRGCDSFPCNAEVAGDRKRYLLGGKLPKKFSDAAASLGFEVTDYYSSEALQQQNAIPTAEGAVMTAMQSLEITLKDCRAAISGFGRIGKRLAPLLLGFGAEVTVFARSDAALEDARLLGCSVCRLTKDAQDEAYNPHIAEVLDRQQILFNTVPNMIFGKEILSLLTNKPLIIELASSPGGIDTEYARDVGLGVVYAPSLPGRYAPESAGSYIYASVSDIMDGKGVKL